MVAAVLVLAATLVAAQEGTPSLPPVESAEAAPAVPATVPATAPPVGAVTVPAPEVPTTIPATRPAIPATLPAATEPVVQPAGTLPAAVALRLSWSSVDHPSGLYYPNEAGKLSILIQNPAGVAQEFAGSFKFVRRTADGTPAVPISITPITATPIAAGQQALLELAVTFATPGTYEIIWDQHPLAAAAAGGTLECIYAPRGAEAAPGEAPWIAPLPANAFMVAGFLEDYAKRTGVHRFVWDCPWQPGQQGAPAGDGHALTEPELAAALQGLKASGSQLVVRLRVRTDGAAEPAGLSAYVTALLAKCNGACRAVVVDVDPALVSAAPEVARGIYLAAYAGAKKQGPDVMLLGFSHAAATRALLSGLLAGARLDDYVDAVAVDGTPADTLWAMDPAGAGKRAVWILPEAAAAPATLVPAAVALAGGAKVVPVPPGDRGVTLHLLGGAVLYQQLHAACPPFLAVFQGNGLAVAAVAGMGAGTPQDLAWPGLLAAAGVPPRDVTAGPGPDDPQLEVADPDSSFRVVNWAGDTINCRRGDLLRLPVDQRVCYLVASGMAEDLVAALRTADLRNVLEVEVQPLRLLAADAGHPNPRLELRLRNATDHEVKGSIGQVGGSAAVDFIAISPGKFLEITVPVDPAGGPLVPLAVDTGHKTMRVAVRVP